MTANQKTEPVNQQGDIFKWLVVILLMGAIIAANFYFADQSSAIKVAANLVAVLIVIGLASLTIKGKQCWLFAREARMELRKVVWPTRQETVQSTLIIVVVVVVAALFLWGIDSILLWATSFITGQ